MIRLIACVIAATTMLGCGESARPPVEVSGVELYSALPGSSASVGYLTLSNNTRDDIRISRFRSAAFGKVELHETTIENGVARMRRMTDLTLPAEESVSLAPGALHLMLMDPGPDATVGQTVSLTIVYGNGGELRIEAPLLSRDTAGGGH